MSGGDGYSSRHPGGRYPRSEDRSSHRGGFRDRYSGHDDREDCVSSGAERNDYRERGWRQEDRSNRFSRGDDIEDRSSRGQGNMAYRGGPARFGDQGQRDFDNYGIESKEYGRRNNLEDGGYSRDDRDKDCNYDFQNYDQGGDSGRNDFGCGRRTDRNNRGSRNYDHDNFEGRGGSGWRDCYGDDRSESKRYQDQTFHDNYRNDYGPESHQHKDGGRDQPSESYNDGYGRSSERFGGMGDNLGEWDDSNRGARGSSRGGRGSRGRMIRGTNANEDGQRFGGFANRERDTRGCFKCGGPHMARDCTEGPSNYGGPTGEGKRKPVTYVPEESAYDEDQMFSSISKGINFNNYENIPVEVTGNNPPKPINSFEECDIEPELKRNVLRAKYDKPTPIQKWAIPIVLEGRDLMGCAQTGSGKTAGFLLPVLTGLLRHGPQENPLGPSPLALVVGPTRELVTQIYEESRKFSVGTNIKSVVVYGGVSVAHHIGKLRDGADIVIATVGRLLDFVRRGIISLKRVQYLILDEADRMLDMGFKDDILSLCFDFGMPPNTERQTLLFSATFPEDIQQIASTILNDYVFVAVGRVGGANHDIEQNLELVPLDKKKERLIEILESQPEETKTIIFVEKKVMSDFLAVVLCQSGLRSTSIHGDREQREREEALKTLKSGQTPIIVATSVAARGLDIPGIGHVINYDLPKTIDDYVHRIGRTGRCGNIGKATSFYDPGTDSSLAQDLQNILVEAQQEVPPWLLDYCHSSSGYQSTECTRDVRYQGGRARRFGNIERNEQDDPQDWN